MPSGVPVIRIYALLLDVPLETFNLQHLASKRQAVGWSFMIPLGLVHRY